MACHLLAAALGVACSDTPSGPPMPKEDLADDAGWAALGDWNGIPTLGKGGPRRFSSNDRDPSSAFPLTDPGNKDSNNFLAVCGDRPDTLFETVDGDGPCDPGQEGHLIASDDGPGYVSRIFLAVGTLPPDLATIRDIEIGFADERLRIYVDDAEAPAYDGAIVDWERGQTQPFPPELTSLTTGAVVSYAPISYQSKVRVFLDGLRPVSAYYHQVDVHRVEQTAPFDPEAVAAAGARRFDALKRASDEGAETWRDETVALPRGTGVTLLSRESAGTIRKLQLTVAAGTSTALSDLTLRAVWDDAAAPAIELPLSRLFGTAPVPTTFETLPMSVTATDTGVTLTLRLPMPFASRASLSLVNDGAVDHDVGVRIDGSDDVPAVPFGRLHTSPSAEQAPVPSGSRYVVADLAGPGKYAGTVFSFKGTRDPAYALPNEFNFLEADETIAVDGVVIARGTGTEEYVNGGFYFFEGRFDFPFSTLIATETEDLPGGGTAGRARGVRWHLLSDSIHFEDSFLLDFEYGAGRPETMLEYSSVAYHYRE